MGIGSKPLTVFESRFVDTLPGDIHTHNRSRQVQGACYSLVNPTRVANPVVVAFSDDLTEFLGLDLEWMKTKQASAVLGGNELLTGMKPYAACYGGHQFGNWAGQLGDGRAINLGELITSDAQRWTIQLKGAGPTPFSRSGDGLAVLRSSVREFLCSEAMHYLGVPTTRALSLVLTGEQVVRDMFYNGHAREEPGAVVCRVAPTFVRFGNFEILAERREFEILRQLVDYTIANNFPELDPKSSTIYEEWFRDVCERTATMIVHWMRVGFVHGVMNTDNMSILGQTIDYGPYGWLEGYEPDWTPNTTDASHHRYAFGKQPQVAHWNLLQLANALWPLFENERALQAGLDRYVECFRSSYNAMMATKLGLLEFDDSRDAALIEQLDNVLQLVETDMTIFYRRLAQIELDRVEAEHLKDIVSDAWIRVHFAEAYYSPSRVTSEVLSQTRSWLQMYLARLIQDNRCDLDRKSQMDLANPLFVLRNYMAQEAIDLAEQGDFSEVNRLFELLKHPYRTQPLMERYSQKRPEWARNRPGCSMLSCSS